MFLSSLSDSPGSMATGDRCRGSEKQALPVIRRAPSCPKVAQPKVNLDLAANPASLPGPQ